VDQAQHARLAHGFRVRHALAACIAAALSCAAGARGAPNAAAAVVPVADRAPEPVRDAAREGRDEARDGWWLSPIDRAALRIEAVRDAARDYSTPARPRDIAGQIALSCEHQDGRPCGDGLAASGELDAAAGYGAWLAGAVRLRAGAGTGDRGGDLAIDRAFVRAELGPIAAELGRDAVVIGPPAVTRFGWSDQPPPLDHVRLSGARPLAVTRWLGVNAIYVLGRLADPQTYPGDLVSIARGELAIDGWLELGAIQLLQLGGDGAPAIGVWDFVREHVMRRDASAGPSDSSNRRFGGDVTAHIAGFGGARLTYQVLFEDARKRFGDALRYDADHAIDLATRWVTIEWRRTGVRSSEHSPRRTGFTSGGRIAGDPLGPAAHAVRIAGRIPIARGGVSPWAELASLSSDRYLFADHGPIAPIDRGVAEIRARIGVRARVAIGRGIAIDPEAAIEHVERAGFTQGARRTGAMFRTVVAWRPGSKSATLDIP
jgi:hypothetical protein